MAKLSRSAILHNIFNEKRKNIAKIDVIKPITDKLTGTNGHGSAVAAGAFSALKAIR